MALTTANDVSGYHFGRLAVTAGPAGLESVLRVREPRRVPLAFCQCSKPRGGRVAAHGFHLAFLMDDEFRSKHTTAYTPPFASLVIAPRTGR